MTLNFRIGIRKGEKKKEVEEKKYLWGKENVPPGFLELSLILRHSHYVVICYQTQHLGGML